MTDKYAVLGNPIAHSLSPQLHTFFAQNTNQDLEYKAILVPDNDFENTVKTFFKNGGLGCNITVPCKLDAYKFANNLTEYAKAAGAVNTLKVMDDGSVLGDNTDGRGLVYDLLRQKCQIENKDILIIGAGGASLGILKPILDCNPKSISIVNRTYQKALDLANKYDERVKAFSFDNLDGKFDGIINATSTSLKGELPNIHDDIYKNATFAYDLMYKKDGDTIFIEKAKSLGVKQVSDGFGMLVGQAILSFELWRGVKPDFNEAMKKFRPC